MGESNNKSLESLSDAEIRKCRIRRIREKSRAVSMDQSAIKGLEGLELNGSISRIVVKGYDTSPPRIDVEEALRKHFASRGINYALIYVNEECEAEALKLNGSDMGGGRVLKITAYPFDDNHLEHVFAPTKATEEYLQRTLNVTGLDISLAKDDIKKMLLRVFPGSGTMVFGNGTALLYLDGQDAVDKALKLSGGSVGGFKIVVTKVLPLESVHCGFSLARALGLVEEAKPGSYVRKIRRRS